MYGSSAREAVAGTVSGSFNLFLGAQNWLRLSNPSAEIVAVRVTLNGSSGVSESSMELEAGATLNLPIHDQASYRQSPNTYGSVLLENDSASGIIAELIRLRPGAERVEFAGATAVR